MPPMQATTRPDRAAAMRAGPVRTSGRTAQGASSPGSTPPEDEPIRIVNVGHSANAAPAASRVERVPMPTASASRTRPRKPTVTSSDIHSRSATHTGMCSRCAIR